MPIVQRILSAFSKPQPAPLPEPDAKLALGALMVRVAKSDESYRVEEISAHRPHSRPCQRIGPIEAAKMRATCEKLETLAPETDSFAALIRETVSREGRMETLRALWQVLLADGLERPEEIKTINATRKALGLTEEENAAAKAAAIGQG